MDTINTDCYLCGNETDCIANKEGKMECLPCNAGDYFCKCGAEVSFDELYQTGCCHECR